MTFFRRKSLFIIPILLCLGVFSFGQQFTISGYIKDTTNKGMIGVNVYEKNNLKGTVTNEYGFYSITLEKGNHTLVFSSLGFKKQEKSIKLNQNTSININLVTNAFLSKAIIIEDQQKKQNTKSTDMGKIDLNISKVKSLPAFMGEVDILKTIQLLPGVQSAGEGNTGFYVRGGGPDQNLILLEDAVVYNASHLLGFFSVFNADAIKNIKLIKGGMPAEYGGRLASVLDVTMKDGNYKEFKADGGIGLISSRLTLQGPVKKDASSFIMSIRRTYIDALSEPFIPDSSAAKGSGYYFYDLNAKIGYKFNNKNRLFLSGYYGKDVFDFKNSDTGLDIGIPWKNAIGSIKWNHLFNDKLLANTTATFSNYDFTFNAVFDQFKFGLNSGIQDYTLKTDFFASPSPVSSFKFGANYTYHIFTPSNVNVQSGETTFNTGEEVRIYANEMSWYFSSQYDLNDLLRINVGLRHSIFQHLGPYTRYVKGNDGSTTVDTINYTNRKPIKTYHGIEPRFAIRYKLNGSSSLKTSFTQNYQYIHLASISPVSLPTDLWLPSTSLVQPQIGRQYSLGYFKNLKNDTYETSAEIYYKTLENQVEYKEGTLPEDNVNDNVDNNLTFGKGTSYGIELFVKKKFGNTSGWIGYTLSNTTRQFTAINNGERYPAKFDRRHDVSVALTHQLNDYWTFGGTFVYATGNSVTLPESYYVFEGQIVSIYSSRNSTRVPPYHRADVSATYSKEKYTSVVDPDSGEPIQRKKRFQSSWTFSIYNLYSRQNPYFLYIDAEGSIVDNTLEIKAKQVSLFPILPSVVWNFKF